MAIGDAFVIRFRRRILEYIYPQAFCVAERILGIFLAALVVQTMLNGLRELGIVTG
jgi:small neutral amino acid transporter SnatA (MarC family)